MACEKSLTEGGRTKANLRHLGQKEEVCGKRRGPEEVLKCATQEFGKLTGGARLLPDRCQSREVSERERGSKGWVRRGETVMSNSPGEMRAKPKRAGRTPSLRHLGGKY